MKNPCLAPAAILALASAAADAADLSQPNVTAAAARSGNLNRV